MFRNYNFDDGSWDDIINALNEIREIRREQKSAQSK